jgi:rubredoxin
MSSRYVCVFCGFVYDESEGLPDLGIKPNTPFSSLTDFKCPDCGVGPDDFEPEEA